MAGARFDPSATPLATGRDTHGGRDLASRLAERIRADRALPDPAVDHLPGVWPPDQVLAPLADLAVEPVVDLDLLWMTASVGRDGLFAIGPADGRPLEHVLARGTLLRATGHAVDPYHEGLDLDLYDVLDGPDRGATLAVCCGGRWSGASSVANQLVARSEEPILADQDAGVRLLADLRAIADDPWPNQPAGAGSG